jgi:hypothetical protein
MVAKILNQSDGKWVFENLAQMLSRSLWVDISEDVADLNYVLCTDTDLTNNTLNSFIPIDSIKIASDKRSIDQRFKSHNVSRPTTFIVDSDPEIEAILHKFDRNRWILKYPTGCGGMNHRMIEDVSQIPEKWPQPYLIQEFIESTQPQVYRFYCVAGDLFGFNVRKFADPDISNPWVSHTNGARYNYGETPNKEAIEVATSALIATGLYDSFGVVDLINDRSGKWFALEVGTDGIYNHVDRDVANDSLVDELNERLAIAFWRKIGTPPWGKTWKYRA